MIGFYRLVVQELLDQRLGERRVRRAVRQLRHAPRVRQVEALVELAAPTKIRTDEVPGETEDAHATLGVTTRSLEVLLNVATNRGVMFQI